jgi:hypothetical protein
MRRKIKKLRGWFVIVDFEVDKDHNHIKKEIDVLLQDRPDELKRVQENRAFVENFKAEPIADSHKMVPAFGKDVNLNAVLKLNTDKWNEFTFDNFCDMFSSWKLAQLEKYLKKKRGLDFNWMWLLILVFLGIGGLIVVMMFVLPSIGNVI